MHDSSSHDSESPELAAKASAAHEALLALVRTAAGELAHAPESAPPATVNLTWSTETTADELLEQVVHGMRLRQQVAAGYAAGRVHCFRCGRHDCEHSAPAMVTQVFAGYANGGEPIWQELLNELNSLGEERVDQLFETPPRVLARLVSRKHLVEQQLAGGGRHSGLYRVLGQVVLGYVKVGGERYAMTVQVVETVDRKLHLQVIAADALRDALADAPAKRRSLLQRIADALIKLRRAVEGGRGPWQAAATKEARGKLTAQLNTELRQFAASVEQKDRQSTRRTVHAEQRQREQRPVHKASDDVASARPEHFFEDTVRHSKIIVGRAGRCHVFNDDGQHVTTIQLLGDKLDRRIRSKRYVPLSPEQVKAFRPVVEERFRGEDEAQTGKGTGA